MESDGIDAATARQTAAIFQKIVALLGLCHAARVVEACGEKVRNLPQIEIYKIKLTFSD